MLSTVWAAFLAVLMLVSAWSKLADPRGFQAVLHEYRLTTRSSVRRTGRSIVAFECLTGAILLFAQPWAVRAGMVLVLAFLGVVSAAIGLRLARGEKRFRCGCHGDFSRPQSAGLLLARNLGLVVVTVVALRYAPSTPSGLPALLAGAGLFALTQLLIASARAREAHLEWKALG